MRLSPKEQHSVFITHLLPQPQYTNQKKMEKPQESCNRQDVEGVLTLTADVMHAKCFISQGEIGPARVIFAWAGGGWEWNSLLDTSESRWVLVLVHGYCRRSMG